MRLSADARDDASLSWDNLRLVASPSLGVSGRGDGADDGGRVQRLPHAVPAVDSVHERAACDRPQLLRAGVRGDDEERAPAALPLHSAHGVLPVRAGVRGRDQAAARRRADARVLRRIRLGHPPSVPDDPPHGDAARDADAAHGGQPLDGGGDEAHWLREASHAAADAPLPPRRLRAPRRHRPRLRRALRMAGELPQ